MATAQINNLWADHNMWMGPVKGMVIHVNFDVQNFAGQHGKVVAYFAYPNGELLKDFDGLYRTFDGHVSVGLDFLPNFPGTSFPDVHMFMPYVQLHMAPGDSSLVFSVQIWDLTNPVVPTQLAVSSWYPFSFSLPAA